MIIGGIADLGRYSLARPVLDVEGFLGTLCASLRRSSWALGSLARKQGLARHGPGRWGRGRTGAVWSAKTLEAPDDIFLLANVREISAGPEKGDLGSAGLRFFSVADLARKLVVYHLPDLR